MRASLGRSLALNRERRVKTQAAIWRNRQTSRVFLISFRFLNCFLHANLLQWSLSVNRFDTALLVLPVLLRLYVGAEPRNEITHESGDAEDDPGAGIVPVAA